MDNIIVALEFESLQDLYCESSDKASRHALKVILFYEFV